MPLPVGITAPTRPSASCGQPHALGVKRLSEAYIPLGQRRVYACIARFSCHRCNVVGQGKGSESVMYANIKPDFQHITYHSRARRTVGG